MPHKPNFIIAYGPPGSGKSLVRSKVLERLSLPENTVIDIDVDAISAGEPPGLDRRPMMAPGPPFGGRTRIVDFVTWHRSMGSQTLAAVVHTISGMRANLRLQHTCA